MGGGVVKVVGRGSWWNSHDSYFACNKNIWQDICRKGCMFLQYFKPKIDFCLFFVHICNMFKILRSRLQYDVKANRSRGSGWWKRTYRRPFSPLCFSLLEMTEICFGSTKMEILHHWRPHRKLLTGPFSLNLASFQIVALLVEWKSEYKYDLEMCMLTFCLGFTCFKFISKVVLKCGLACCFVALMMIFVQLCRHHIAAFCQYFNKTPTLL